MKMINNKKRIEWVDSLKGIGILAIIATHTNGDEIPGLIGKIVSFGSSFVSLFFIISTFLLFRSLEKIEVNSLSYKEYIKYLFRKKLPKTILILYIAIFVYLIFTNGNSFWLGSYERITILNIITHFLLVNGFFPHFINSIIGVEWYISVLLMIYLIGPFLYRIINSRNKSIYNYIVGSILSIIIVKLFNRIQINVSDYYIYSNFLSKFNIIAQYSNISAGILLFYINKELKRKNKLLSISLFVISILLIFLCIIRNYVISGLSIVISTSFSLLILSQMIYPSKLLNNKLFIYLGNKSLYIYLFHMLIIEKIQFFFNKGINNTNIEWMIQYSIVLISTLILSFFIDKLIIGIQKHINQ